MKYIVEASGISKSFFPPFSFKKILQLDLKRKNPVNALTDVSFSLEKGKILCILGENGAGKTTLLKIIATIILPDSGTLSVNGQNDEEKIKRYIGLVTAEERSFYWRLSGRKNLEFFSALYGFSKKETNARIAELLRLFEIDYADRMLYSYSVGMKKRFSLIRGLIHNPGLLLLDEPTKSLDYTTAFNLRNFVKEKLVKEQKKSLIFTTHQMDEAEDFADLFMVLRKGRISALGTKEEMRKLINAPCARMSEIFLKLTENNV